MLRDGGGQNLREYLIETAARLIDQRGDAGLSVRDIARAAKVADGVLYNYFEDKEDLLAHALLVHVGSVMSGMPPLPDPGGGTLARNLATVIPSAAASAGCRTCSRPIWPPSSDSAASAPAPMSTRRRCSSSGRSTARSCRQSCFCRLGRR